MPERVIMPLTTGSKLGSYEIVAPLGAGGMGEVFRARDARLGRDVALKVLPDLFAKDPDRLARFKREAQLLAALNHPNIAAIYGLEDSGPSTSSGHAVALVLELVEGPTLADRIAEGPIPLDEAMRIARQIGGALEAAHEQGIIHRDLKPANIKVRPDGTVKVLDFGLAKALEPVAPVGDQPAAPTITSPALTRMGVILGTAAYMSPEQAKGRAADKRSDIWAFGCVLFEMLTGSRPFEGQEVSDTLASVLKSDPEWQALPAALPPTVRALVEGCLKKDPHDRIADISTARFVLGQPHDLDDTYCRSLLRLRASVWRRVVPVLAGAAVGAAAIIATMAIPRGNPPPPPAQVTRFTPTLPANQQFTLARHALAIAPDGTHIVYAADGRLYLRSLSEFDARPIAGTEGALNPMFSPDGQTVAFWAGSTLKRIDIGGGVPVDLYRAASVPPRTSWDDKGIMFSQWGTGHRARLARRRQALRRCRDRRGHRPSGQSRSCCPMAARSSTPCSTRAASTTTVGTARVSWSSRSQAASAKRSSKAGATRRYVPTGHIVYAVRGTLFARAFDLPTLGFTGGAVPVVEGVRRATAAVTGTAQYAFSNSGALVYLPGPTSEQEGVFVYDRKGGAQALKLPPGLYRYPRVSPDGTRVAFDSSDGKEAFVSIYRAVRHARAGPDHVRQQQPLSNLVRRWQARRVSVGQKRNSVGVLAGHRQPERRAPDHSRARHIARARSVVARRRAALQREEGNDVLALVDVDGKSTGEALRRCDLAGGTDGCRVLARRPLGHLSDGGSMHDTSDMSTFVQPFPATGTKHEIGRGGRPVWSPDRKELFFIPAPGQLRMVQFTTQPIFSFTSPVAVPRQFGIAGPGTARTFDFLPDGRIIGVGSAVQGSNSVERLSQIHVVLNWFAELKARVPVR